MSAVTVQVPRMTGCRTTGFLAFCYTCGSGGTVGAAEAFDPVADRPAWPQVPCFFTPGCTGRVEPEALN